MNKEKILTIIKYILISFLFIIFVVAGTTSGIVSAYIGESPPLDLSNFDYIQPSIILDAKGQFYEELQGKEKREIVSIDIIPEHVRNAFIAIEDQRFREHFGIDMQGITRAFFQGVKEKDPKVAGGSTITQQLIKLTHLSPKKEFSRKIKEAYLSIKLERVLDKDQILENYLNKINFSYAHGIQAASNTYFRKDVEDLSIAQAAVLAAIPKAPSHYRPYVIEKKEDGSNEIALDGEDKILYSNNNQNRALAVIEKMKELAFINEEEYEVANKQLLNNDFGLKPPPSSSIYSYFTDTLYEQVVQDLIEEYYPNEPIEESREKAVDYLLNSGLRIYSTIDVNIQSLMDKNFQDDKLFPKQSSHAKNASREKSKELDQDINYSPEGAMVVIENTSGEVKGIVGGRNKEGNLSLNRALRGFQPGSSTKPLTVYAPGIDSKKVTLANTYDDVPIRVPIPGTKPWEPGNAGGGNSGLTTIRRGLTRSLNIVAVQAFYDIGLETSIEYGEKFGLNMKGATPSGLALGGSNIGQTPLAMASAFTTFPNMGLRKNPTFYTKVVDATGEVILENKKEGIEVISPQTAYLITDVLKDVPRGGTTNISIPKVDIAGKTGTTNDQRHAWFVGYTPYYTSAVWYGYDNNLIVTNGKKYHLNINIYGGSKPGPALMWEKVMGDIHKDLKAVSFPDMPKGIEKAKIDTVSGKIPTSLSYQDPRGSRVVTEMFISGTVPKEKDNYHVSIGGRVYIQKPGDRFPSPVEPINSGYHPENRGGTIAISPSQINKIIARIEKEKEEERHKKEEEKATEMEAEEEDTEEKATKEEKSKQDKNKKEDIEDIIEKDATIEKKREENPISDEKKPDSD